MKPVYNSSKIISDRDIITKSKVLNQFFVENEKGLKIIFADHKTKFKGFNVVSILKLL